MAEVRILRRPTSREELPDTFRQLGQFCEELGIDHGDKIMVAKYEVGEDGLPPEKIAQHEMGGFARDSETSRQAALDNYFRKPTQQWEVLLMIAEAGQRGMIREEIVEAGHLGTQSVTARCAWLKNDAGWIEEDGRKRQTTRGSNAAVLTVTPEGYAALEYAVAHMKLER